MELGRQRGFQAADIPLLLDAFGRDVEAEGVVDLPLAHGGDGLGDVVAVEQFVALLVDHLALVVGDVVVFEQLLADVEVALLDLALRRFQRAADQRMLDGLAFGHLERTMMALRRSPAKMRSSGSSSDR
jgi:hypothetical protein